MSSKPESRLHRKIMSALMVEFPGSWWMKVHGGPFQPAGVPDLMGIVKGRAVLIEVKRPQGTTSRIQHLTMKRLSIAGAIVGVAMTPTEAIAIVTDGLNS